MNEEKIISRDALIDDRPKVLKDKDYSTKEITTSAVVPFQNDRIRELGATEYNQWYVGSCVPHAFWTQLEYEGIINADFKPSQLRSYRKRSNYPNPGSIGPNMYDMIRDGQSNDFPTPARFREADATKMSYVKGEKLIKDFNYFQYIDKKTGLLDITDVPKDIANGKSIAIFFYATDEEWSKEYVEILGTSPFPGAEVQHAVCLIKEGDFTKDGKQWLSVHDSAKFGGRHLRYVSWEFLKKRCYFAAKVYKVDTVPDPVIPPVKGLPLLPCELGDNSNEVRHLQKYLIDEGKLDKKYLTGYYGSLTAKAVIWWQLENWQRFDSSIPQLLDLAGNNWGPQSIRVLKELTNND